MLEFFDTTHALGLLKVDNKLLVSGTESQIHQGYCLDSLFVCMASKIVEGISSSLHFIKTVIVGLWGIGCTSTCTSSLLKETFLLAPQLLILLFFRTTKRVLVPLLLVQSAVLTMLIENLIVIGLIVRDSFSVNRA